MLCLIKTKGCRRCGGDLSLECDIYGVYATCIQCGASWSRTEMVVQPPPQATVNKKAEKTGTLVGTASKR